MTMKRNPGSARRTTTKREQLNVLVEAVALLIARRQMKKHWGTGHRVALTSFV
jgi:hypothetical protein